MRTFFKAIGVLAFVFPACAVNSGAGSGQSPVAGGDGGSQDDGGAGSDGGGTTGAHAPFPKVTYQGGPLVTAPKVVTVTFQGDTMAAQLASFGQSVASSSWWDAVRGDFCATNGTTCVGDGPSGTNVELTQAAAASYTDSAQGGVSSLQTFIAGLITNNTIPQPDANSIYVFYVPRTTTITLDGDTSCNGFDGYHNAMKVGGKDVYFAVVIECAPTENVSLLEYTTATAAHEIIETATDPADTPGFYLDTNDPATWGWNDIEGGEVADLCTDPFSLGQDLVQEGGFTVQRVWSPNAAAANKNPCIPVPAGEVYFNAAPNKSILAIDVGQSKTVEVDAFADGAIGPWTLTAQDWTDPNTQYLSFSFDGGTQTASGAQVQVSSGAKVQLTVTLKADPTKSTNGEADAVLVSSNGDPKAASKANWWPFVVMTPAAAADAGVTGASLRVGAGRVHKIGKRRRFR